MQAHALVAGEDGGVAHQFAADRKGEQGQRHPNHGADPGREGAIRRSLSLRIAACLDQRVGAGRPAFADGHGAARGGEADADFGGGLNAVVKPRAVRKEIEVVG